MPFQPYSFGRLRNELQRELGRGFEVSVTPHYVVAHPRGHGAEWAGRFEELYQSFRHYFLVRGFRLSEPEFPLIAVVLRSQQEFQQYNNKQGARAPRGLLGYYSSATNRVTMYDVTNGQSKRAWFENAATIIHEATHQTAFNTGVHNRLRPPPRWVCEGLGMLFEARGVWDSRHVTGSGARINRDRLAQFHSYAASRRKPDAIQQLVISDRRFRTGVNDAYAESWALTYYLVETQPRKFAEFLQRTAGGPNFTEYSAGQRWQDFTTTFGENFPLLNAKFVRYMKDAP